jgi:hypothetical protein
MSSPPRTFDRASTRLHSRSDGARARTPSLCRPTRPASGPPHHRCARSGLPVPWAVGAAWPPARHLCHACTLSIFTQSPLPQTPLRPAVGSPLSSTSCAPPKAARTARVRWRARLASASLAAVGVPSASERGGERDAASKRQPAPQRLLTCSIKPSHLPAPRFQRPGSTSAHSAATAAPSTAAQLGVLDSSQHARQADFSRVQTSLM